MTDYYPIIEVQPDQVLQLEGMGSKEKHWYQVPEVNESQWLFKQPARQSSGEHWAEKIVAEVAELLSVPHARVELAELQGRVGSITENVVPEHFELIHGNEVLESAVSQQDTGELNFHLSDHTLANIWLVLNQVFEAGDAANAKRQFAQYLVLDAVVGNVDRHSENWGMLRGQVETGFSWSLASSYDHGSSLGRELSDEQRDRRLAGDRVGEYVERGRGGIFWSSVENRGPSPLQLVRLAADTCPDALHSAISMVDSLDDESLRRVVDRVSIGWMTCSARSFAFEMMRYGRAQMLEAVR